MKAAVEQWTISRVPGVPEGRLDGPVWDGAGLLFCLPERNEIHRLDAATGTATRLRHTTSGASSLAFAPDGRLYGGQPSSRRVVWYEPSGGTYYLDAMLDGARQNDPQDLVVGRDGAIWLTDDWTAQSSPGPVNWPLLDHRSVLRLAQVAETEDGIGDWRLVRATTDTVHPHGIALAPDGATLYVADRASQPVLRAYRVDGERLGAGRVVHGFAVDDDADPAISGPWGMTVASDGTLLVAVGPRTDGGEAAILLLGSDGAVLGRHDLAGDVPTNLAFGGPDRGTLYVTTDRGLLAIEATGLRGIEGGGG